jgi:predicted Zn-dependent protease with MMP-like domain
MPIPTPSYAGNHRILQEPGQIPGRARLFVLKDLPMPSDQPGTQEDFELAVQAIWDGLPEQFRAALGNVTVHVADFADAETLKAMHISDAYDLLGLYHGMGLPFKSVSDPANLPDRIFLYRIPILSYAHRNSEPMDRVIRHVLIHEIGHHFGFSDADMALIESRR